MKHVIAGLERFSLIILLSIILFGGFLRFYNLSSNPPALNWDEVAIGYNAYSVLTTGKDEYGKFLPLYFRSLDDYKRPVYIYITVGSVALFGLTDFAVRFPSAFFGTLTILLIYLIAYELFAKKILALLSAFFLAITPWHIQFSHAAFEATVGFFFTALGVLCMLWGVRKNLWYLPIAFLAFGLSMYSYLGQRVAVPILIVTLLFLYRKYLVSSVKSKKRRRIPILVAGVILSVFFLSLTRDAFMPEGNIRYKATSIFSNSSEYEVAFRRMQVDAAQKINLTRRLFHDNSLFTSVELVMRGYLTHFSPDFFFFDLGQQHHHAPGVGILYIWMLPFLLIGIYALFRKEDGQTRLILLAWILGPPVAAAVTYQIPHALRVGEMILPMIMVIALGATVFFQWLYRWKKFFVFPVLMIFVIAGGIYLLYFFHQYTIHLPEERSQEWVYGRREMVTYAEANKYKYDKVIVSTQLEFPYIFFLYYMQYPPSLYFSQGGTRSGSWAEEGNKFDRYEFHKFNYLKDSMKGNYLFIGKPDEFPSNVVPLKKISYLNGEPAIYIVE